MPPFKMFSPNTLLRRTRRHQVRRHQHARVYCSVLAASHLSCMHASCGLLTYVSCALNTLATRMCLHPPFTHTQRAQCACTPGIVRIGCGTCMQTVLLTAGLLMHEDTRVAGSAALNALLRVHPGTLVIMFLASFNSMLVHFSTGTS